MHDAVLELRHPRAGGRQRRRAAAAPTAIPADDDVPALRRVHWAERRPDAARGGGRRPAAATSFPLLLCAYGCGPNSMVEHLFDDLLEDYPHAVLESDGHGGKAGYVTRVQAFLHAVRRTARRAAWRRPRPRRVRSRRHALERCERPVGLSLRSNRDAATPLLFGHVGGSLRPLCGRRHARRRPRRALRGRDLDGGARQRSPGAAPARSACPTSSSGAASPASSRSEGDTLGRRTARCS